MASVPSTLPAPASDSVELLGVPIWNPTYETFQLWWNQAMAGSRRTRLMGIANAHSLNLAHERPSLRACLCAMDVVLNDGIGAAIAARFRGSEFHYNFNGTDLIPRLLAETQREIRVYLYGASPASNAGAALAIERQFPNVRVVGRMHGFADPELAARSIARSNADLLLVALGQPKQEFFLIEHREALNVKVACGVGALFDFLSGTSRRAPRWVRSLRMEWAYRLLREPVRLFHRYVVGNPKFLWRAVVSARTDAPREVSTRAPRSQITLAGS